MPKDLHYYWCMDCEQSFYTQHELSKHRKETKDPPHPHVNKERMKLKEHGK